MDIKEIMNQLDKISFFTELGIIPRKQRGTQWECDCPFCGAEKHLNINVDSGLWICYKCEAKGNPITFLCLKKGVSKGDAVKEIKAKMGIKDENPTKHKRPAKPQTRKASHPEKPNKPNSDPGTCLGTLSIPEQKPRAAIYQRLIELAHLSPEHREELKTKRGFSEETINLFCYRSGGAYIRDVVAQLRQEFSGDDLIQSGVLVEVNGTLLVNNQIQEDWVLIPYLNEEGKVYHLRPHKLGFKGIPIQPYSRYLLKGKPEHIVLAESEFKAAALFQWGIPAIGVPGVPAFGDKNLPRLIELLKEFGVRKVTVIFDNEEKGNPAYPNFKEKIDNRYDTQYWSYMNAYKLAREGKFETRIGWMPDDWRVQGKIDFDMALAQGRTRNDILQIINQAVTPTEFLATLSEEAQRIVKRKITRYFAKQNIRREFNKYVTTRYRGDESYDETISNFVINIKSSFFTPNGVIRNVELVNEYGETSTVFSMDPASMAGMNEFKKFCFSKGNYVFEGKGDDLTDIWKLEFSRNTGEFIYQPDRIGRIEKDLWLFGNLAIKGGQVYRPDSDGIIWIDGKGYKPQSLQIDSRGEAIEDVIPSLWDKPINILEIAENLRQSLGGAVKDEQGNTVGGYEGYMAIGWVIATIYSQEIFDVYKGMPILFPHGKRGSGKTTLMRWIMAFFGIETEGTGIAETSQNFVARALSYYSSLGCWFDEYRNEPKITRLDSFFRSAYNRQLSGKGTPTAFQARGFAVSATVAISGEELPKDTGLMSRSVPLQTSIYKRDREPADWLNRNSGRFSGLAFHLITNYETYREKILSNIAKIKADLVSKGMDDRTAEVWGICAGSFETVVKEDNGFIAWAEQECQVIRRTSEDEHMLGQFWDDVSILVADKVLNLDHFRVDIGADGNIEQLFFWYPAVYDKWATHYRRKTGREPFDRTSILKYILEEPYVLDKKQVVTRINGSIRRTYAVDLSLAPEVIMEIAAALLPAGTQLKTHDNAQHSTQDDTQEEVYY